MTDNGIVKDMRKRIAELSAKRREEASRHVDKVERLLLEAVEAYEQNPTDDMFLARLKRLIEAL